jgi:hypothetical protein
MFVNDIINMVYGGCGCSTCGGFADDVYGNNSCATGYDGLQANNTAAQRRNNVISNNREVYYEKVNDFASNNDLAFVDGQQAQVGSFNNDHNVHGANSYGQNSSDCGPNGFGFGGPGCGPRFNRGYGFRRY